MIYTVDLPSILNGRAVGTAPTGALRYISIDSRNILITANTAFIAIKGERNDGHQFIPELYQKGIRLFIVQEGFDEKAFPSACFIVVGNTLMALQKLAAVRRAQFDRPVIGITGSNGKTIVKEWLSEILSQRWHVVKSPKSYNSQVGVPLSAWQIEPYHDLAILEAGISTYGEMEKLERIINPDIGILTNIGSAHSDGFENKEQKIREKLILFKRAKKIVFQADDAAVLSAVRESGHSFELISWSRKGDARYRVPNIIKSSGKSTIYLSGDGIQHRFEVPFSDEPSLQNAVHCIVTALELGMEGEMVQSGLLLLKNVPMRLALKAGINDCFLVDDTYNNDLAGLETAIDFMVSLKKKQDHTLILSDIAHAGEDEAGTYKHISELISSKGINKLYGIGPGLSRNKHLFKVDARFYLDTTGFLSEIDKLGFSNQMILVKGARHFHFEAIVNALQLKVHGTVMEVNLEAMVHNLNFYKAHLSSGTKVMAMVKAFSYGSGTDEIANLLQYHRVDYLAVAYTDEGVGLRAQGVQLPIMVMNPGEDTYASILKYDLEPEIYSLRTLNAFLAFRKEHRKTKQRIHIKIDTGMHRLGFGISEIGEVCKRLAACSDITVASVFSHLAASEDPAHDDFTLQQIEGFQKASDQIVAGLGYKPLMHILNTAGIMRFPQAHFDMVRVGIGLYGVETAGWEAGKLQCVNTLRTNISQIRHLKRGDTVGYGRRGVIETDEAEVATIAIGYADGFSRRLGNGNGYVLVNGRKAPTLGAVSMDMAMVDVTGLGAREGDEVVVFNHELTVHDLARQMDTIPYEVLTGISERVKRVFFTG